MFSKSFKEFWGPRCSFVIMIFVSLLRMFVYFIYSASFSIRNPWLSILSSWFNPVVFDLYNQQLQRYSLLLFDFILLKKKRKFSILYLYPLTTLSSIRIWTWLVFVVFHYCLFPAWYIFYSFAVWVQIPQSYSQSGKNKTQRQCIIFICIYSATDHLNVSCRYIYRLTKMFINMYFLCKTNYKKSRLCQLCLRTLKLFFTECSSECT